MGTGLMQNGTEKQGIVGFLWEDIQNSLAEWQNLKCYVCKEKSASIQCANRSCRKSIHMVCAMKSKCLFEFREEYNVFCEQHSNIVELRSPHLPKAECFICMETITEDYHPITSIPSCCNDTWFHRHCIQKAAISSGYSLKCPTCGKSNEETNFREYVRGRGIYVPDQDAAWETQNAFADQLEMYSRCDVSQCKCLNGRDYAEKEGEWSIIVCDHCSAKGIHHACNSKEESFTCDDCTAILANIQNNKDKAENEKAEPNLACGKRKFGPHSN